MKKFLAFLFASMLVAASANGTTYYVATTGSDDSLGTSLGTAWATIGKANATAVSGDVVLVSNGTYAGSIAPEAANVSFVGDSAAPNKVIVAGGNFTKNTTTVNGFRLLAELTGNAGSGLHIRNSVLVRGLQMSDKDAGRIEACRIGTDSTEARFWLQAEDGVDSWTIKDNTFKLRDNAQVYASSSFWFALHSVGNWQSSDNSLINNKLTLTLVNASGLDKMVMIRMPERLTSRDNKWTFNDSTNSTATGPQGFLVRDRVKNCSFLRDTIIQHTYFAGKGVLFAQLIGAGATLEGNDNVWKFCVFKSDIQLANDTYGQFYLWQFQPRDSFYHNVVVCSTATDKAGFRVNTLLGPVVIYRNTFFNKGTGGAARFGNVGSSSAGCNWSSGVVRIIANIFYTGAAGSGSNAYAVFYPIRGGVTAIINRNLYSHYAGTGGSRDIMGGNCVSQTFYTPGSLTTFWGALGRDVNSIHGSPRFTDSTFANFNPIPLGGATPSAAIDLGFGGETAGAVDTTGTTGDGTRPDEITDLQAYSSSSSGISLSWTATGDDSLTGTALVYDIRYSTTEITAGNFSSATAWPGPFPSTVGSTERVTVSGLPVCTTYYFAVKAKDDGGNWSAISNVVSRSTLTGSGGPCTSE